MLPPKRGIVIFTDTSGVVIITDQIQAYCKSPCYGREV
jgi:hypothetical protein